MIISQLGDTWIDCARISSPYISAARELATAPVSRMPSEATIYSKINI